MGVITYQKQLLNTKQLSKRIRLIKPISHPLNQMSRSTSATQIVSCSYHSLLCSQTRLQFILAPTQYLKQYGSKILGKLCCPCSTAFLRTQQSLVEFSSSGPSSFKQQQNISSNARNSVSEFQEGAATYILESKCK